MKNQFEKFPAHKYGEEENITIFDRDEETNVLLKKVELNPEALSLLKNYYHDKYDTVIQWQKNIENSTIIPQIKKLSTEQKDSAHDHRAAFVITTRLNHSYTIIYVREKNADHDFEEGVIIIDSQGSWDKTEHKELAKCLWQELNTQSKQIKTAVYAVEGVSQEDHYSCHVFAMTIAKDATAKDMQTHEYILPHLLAQIKKRPLTAVEDVEGYYYFLLPNELLKAIQYKPFLMMHEENDEANANKIVHKKTSETLKKFHARYKKVINRPFNDFLRQKGLKDLTILPIQFYCDQISNQLGMSTWENCRNEFIQAAKKILRNEQSENSLEVLFEYANNFFRSKKQLVETANTTNLVQKNS